MTAPRTRYDESGITLLEVIIAIVVSGLLMSGIATVFLAGLNGAPSSSQRVRETNDAQTISAFLVRDAQAAGGINPMTGVNDSSLGVFADQLTTGPCAIAGTVVRFRWIDWVAESPVTYDVVYSLDAPEFSRTVCTTVGEVTNGQARAQLAGSVASVTAKCNVTEECSPGGAVSIPNSVSLTVTETNNPPNAPAPYTYTLTASVRSTSSPTGDAAQSNSAALALITVPNGGCPGILIRNSSTVRFYGDAQVGAADTGGCNAVTLNGDVAWYHDDVLVSAGGTCGGSGVCPATATPVYPIVDPWASLTAPSAEGLPPRSGCAGGRASPGVYADTLALTGRDSCVLQSGVYIFQNGISVADFATLESGGGGATVYLSGGSFSLSSNATVNLAAQSTGPYAGLTLWQQSSATITVGAQVTLTMHGSWYAPSATIDFQNRVATAQITTLVAASTVFENQASVDLGPVPPPLKIDPITLPPWTAGQPNYPGPTVTGSGGHGKYNWSITGPAADGGLTIDPATGVIGGTAPSQPGVYTATITLNDALHDAPASFNVNVTINPPPTITTVTVPRAQPNRPYQATLASTGGTAPLSWAVTAGALPPGLVLDADGVIHGTATTVARYDFTVTVTDAADATDSQALTMFVGRPPTITSVTPATRGQGALDQPITISGTNFQSAAVVVFSDPDITLTTTTFVSSSELIAYVNVSKAAALAASDVTVTNPDGGTITSPAALTITQAPSITTLAPNVLGQGAANQTIVVTGANFVPNATVSFSDAGVTVNSITYNSATSLTLDVTVDTAASVGARDVTVTNPDGGSSTAISVFAVDAAPTISSVTPSSHAGDGTAFAVVITGTGFAGGASVGFTAPGVTVNGTKVDSPTQITVNVTIANNTPPAAGDVTVTNADGGAVTRSGGFAIT